MSFIADKQTLEDLNIAGKYKGNSIFNVFNHTRTRGGERVLEKMFQQPLSDVEEINKRSAIFHFFSKNVVTFPFDKQLLDAVELYLARSCPKNKLVATINLGCQKFMGNVVKEKDFELICSGYLAMSRFLNIFRNLAEQLCALEGMSVYADSLALMSSILENKEIMEIQTHAEYKRIPFRQLARYDYVLRSSCLENIKRMMEQLYLLDVYIAVGRVARENRFTRALAAPKEKEGSYIRLAHVFHPQVARAVSNSICVDARQNVIFLTGANMAGKSTLMKSFGIAVYLAHMGFPVAAEKMEFTLYDGIYTSINVPDNLNSGYSHFYAEVLRVKKVAQEVGQSKNLVIIFDELFKGTNVKDAYDATVAVTEAFALRSNCSYIISTHITEAGHTLRERSSNMKFVFLPTIMEGNIPRYTYKLETGITGDRHGMMIIRNEGILDILNNDKQPKTVTSPPSL